MSYVSDTSVKPEVYTEKQKHSKDGLLTLLEQKIEK